MQTGRSVSPKEMLEKIINTYIDKPTEENFKIIESIIAQIKTTEQASFTFSMLQELRRQYSAKHLRSADIDTGILEGGLQGMFASSLYEGVMYGSQAVASTTYAGLFGAFFGLACELVSTEQANKKKPEYAVFAGLLALEKMAKQQEIMFAKPAEKTPELPGSLRQRKTSSVKRDENSMREQESKKYSFPKMM